MKFVFLHIEWNLLASMDPKIDLRVVLHLFRKCHFSQNIIKGKTMFAFTVVVLLYWDSCSLFGDACPPVA